MSVFLDGFPRVSLERFFLGVSVHAWSLESVHLECLFKNDFLECLSRVSSQSVLESLFLECLCRSACLECLTKSVFL